MKISKNIQNFIKLFPGAVICQKKTDTASSGFTVAHSDLMKTDTYFYINGSAKKENITNINACYVDLDAGRDKNGKYLQKKLVEKKKVDMRKRIAAFPAKPSFLVETRNGFQVYWKFSEPVSIKKLKQWDTIQKRICSFFKDVGGDPKAIKVNQIFRVPHTRWYKKYEGIKEVFDVKLFFGVGLKQKTNNGTAYYSYSLRQLASITKNIKLDLPKKSYSKQNNFLKNEVNCSKTASKLPETLNENLLQQIYDYLNDISPILFFKGNKYLSNQAKYLAAQISKEFTIS